MRFSLIVAICALFGCSKSALPGSVYVDAAQDRSDDSGTTDGEATLDATADAGTPPDATTGSDAAADQVAPPDATTDAGLDGDGPPMAVPRSFVVTSTVTTDGGLAAAPLHTFTMVLAADQRSAIVGAGGTGSMVSVEPAGAGALRFHGSVGFALSSVFCSSSVSYSDLTFSIGASGQLSGTGQGSVLTLVEDTGSSSTATMSLAGVPDTEPPTFNLTIDSPDPFVSFTVTASEPLPPTARPVLRSSGGDEIVLAPFSTSTFVSAFAGPATLLRFGETYRVVVEGIPDFAGNPARAVANLPVTTMAAPPLVPEDGFESATGTTLGGAQLLSGATAPTITGTRSLYIPSTGNSIGPRPRTTQLALRLALAPGDTVIRFSYRTVNPNSSGNAGFVFGGVGGTLGGAVLPPDTGPPATANLPDGQVMLGPIMTAEFPLLAGTANEIVLARTTSGVSCGGFAPPIAGLIIDDLRVE